MVAALLNLLNSITFPGSGSVESFVSSGLKGDACGGKPRTFEVKQGADGFSYYLKVYSHGHEATRVVGAFASAEEAFEYLNSNY
jgi:hypothetical protein